MRELLRSNDLVHLSWAQAALAAAGIESVLLDAHISSIEGNIGAFPRRLMVQADLIERARKVLAQAGQAHASG
jgi:Putative prokaryotic signal transducing protein